MSQDIIENARLQGYRSGLQGLPSTPPMHSELARRAYEQSYDIGRAARQSEREGMEE